MLLEYSTSRRCVVESGEREREVSWDPEKVEWPEGEGIPAD